MFMGQVCWSSIVKSRSLFNLFAAYNCSSEDTDKTRNRRPEQNAEAKVGAGMGRERIPVIIAINLNTIS